MSGVPEPAPSEEPDSGSASAPTPREDPIVKLTGDVSGLPFSIREAGGRLCHAGTLPEETLSLSPGWYSVDSFSLDGRPISRAFEVRRGIRHLDITIGPVQIDDKVESFSEKRTMDNVLEKGMECAGPILLNHLPVTLASGRTPVEWNVQYYTPGPCGQFTPYESIRSVRQGEFVTPPSPPGALCMLLQVVSSTTMTDLQSLFFMIPTSGRFRGAFKDGVVGVEVELHNYSAQIQTAMLLFNSGQKRAAGEVISTKLAKSMLAGKLQDPISAVAAAYILLATGNAKKREEWILNLHEWFPALSDGTIIAAEIAAREGDSESACQLLRQLADRPFPLFLEGYSLAVSRTRQLRRLQCSGLDKISQAYQARSQGVDYSTALLSWSVHSLNE